MKKIFLLAVIVLFSANVFGQPYALNKEVYKGEKARRYHAERCAKDYYGCSQLREITHSLYQESYEKCLDWLLNYHKKTASIEVCSSDAFAKSIKNLEKWELRRREDEYRKLADELFERALVVEYYRKTYGKEYKPISWLDEEGQFIDERYEMVRTELRERELQEVRQKTAETLQRIQKKETALFRE